MKALRNLMLVAVVVGTMTVMGARSFAGPLPSFPGVWNPGDYVMGQSTLQGTGTPAQDIEIDWVVMFLGPAPSNPFGIPVGAPVWAYYYQIEASTTTVVARFVVTTPGPPFVFATSVSGDLDAGLPGGDPLTGMDIPAHNLGALETEGATGGIQAVTLTELYPTSARWNFLTPGAGPIPAGWESEILVAYALVPPTYGNASATDDIPPSPWSTLAGPRGEPVPIPSPEPTIAFMFLAGLLVGGMKLKHRRL
jgi:hypothetical protein